MSKKRREKKARKLLEKQQARLERPPEVPESEWMPWVLSEVRKCLEGHGVSMDHCPPMFYPEAIHNLAVWSAKAGMECQRDHNWHDGDLKKVGECIHAWIKKVDKAPETWHDVEGKMAIEKENHGDSKEHPGQGGGGPSPTA